MIRRDRWRAFWRPSVQADIEAEVAFHLGERIEALVATGMSPAEARQAALREFGDAAETARELRVIDERRLGRAARQAWWRDWRNDVRWAVRSLRRTPVVTLTIVVTLALGLGANGAILSLLDAIYLRPPAGVTDGAGIRRLWFQRNYRNAEGPTYSQAFYYGHLARVRAAIGDRAALTAYRHDSRIPLGPEQDAPTVAVTYADSGYFPLLGLSPARGRLFSAEETALAARIPVAIVSDRFWRSRLGADPALPGGTVRIRSTEFTVIGILPPAFQGTELHVSDIWLPIGYVSRAPRWWDDPNINGMSILLRPGPGAPEADLVARATAALRGDTDSTSLASVGPLLTSQGPAEASQELRLTLRLAGVAAIVLLIGFANVANLLMARAAHRRREIAVRLALGISRARLVRLLTTEALLLAALAAGAALLAAHWAGAALRRLLLPDMVWAAPPVTPKAALLTIGIALLAGGLIGVLTALRGRREPLEGLRAGTRGDTPRRAVLRRTLTAAQAALSVVLIAGAALLGASLRNVEDLDLGYDTAPIVFAQVINAPEGAGRRLPEVAARLRTIPGVEATALTAMAPISAMAFIGFRADGGDEPARPRGAIYATADSGYFGVMGLRFLQGSGFTGDAATEVVVNQAMATDLWGTASPLGRCLRFGDDGTCWAVTGVVENMIANRLFEKPEPQLYLNGHHHPEGANDLGTVIVRAAPGQRPVTQIRAAMAEAFPGSTIWVTPFRDILEPQYRPWSLGATLFTLFALLAALVVAVGIYSMVAYDVQQRTREFGIRSALGATGERILAMVVGDGVRTVAIGAFAGLLLSLALGRLVASLLYDVSATDPVILGGVTLAMLLLAVAAALMPAWRAARLDPARTLQAE